MVLKRYLNFGSKVCLKMVKVASMTLLRRHDSNIYCCQVVIRYLHKCDDIACTEINTSAVHLHAAATAFAEHYQDIIMHLPHRGYQDWFTETRSNSKLFKAL